MMVLFCVLFLHEEFKNVQLIVILSLSEMYFRNAYFTAVQ